MNAKLDEACCHDDIYYLDKEDIEVTYNITLTNFEDLDDDEFLEEVFV